MATRHQARECVVSLLYAKDIGNAHKESFIEEILEERKIRNKQREFVLELYNGVVQNLEKIDDIFKTNLKDWDFDRIGMIEKAIIRLAVYELLFTKLDSAVIINEAIEIGKNFASDNSPKFINGLLETIKKGLSR